MSVNRYHPRRRLRSEFFPLAAVIAVSAAVAGLFPREAVGFVPRKLPAVPGGFCTFVELDAAAEAKAVAAARTSWQSDSGDLRRLRAEVLPASLPASDRPVPALSISSLLPGDGPVACGGLPRPRGIEAPPPVQLPREAPASAPPPIPREELLRLN